MGDTRVGLSSPDGRTAMWLTVEKDGSVSLTVSAAVFKLAERRK